MEAYATSDQTSNTTLKHLKTLIGRFGVPKIFHSDQEPNYESSDFQTFFESNMIKKTTKTRYPPESNGVEERTVQTLKQKIKQLSENHNSNWDNYLFQALMSMRNTVHKSTKFTPSMILYGQNLRSVSEAKLDVKAQTIADRRSIVKTSKENLLNAQKKNLLTYNQKFSSGTTFKVRDTIIIKKPHSTSIDTIFSTPVEIVSVDQPVYTVKTSENKIFKIHHNRTKRYGTEIEKIPTFDNYLESDSDDEHPNVEEKSNENSQQYPEKTTIKIPSQNLEYCKRWLPSFIKRGGMSEEALVLGSRVRILSTTSFSLDVSNGIGSLKHSNHNSSKTIS